MALRRGLLRGSLLGSRALLTPAYQQSAIASTALHSIVILDDIRRNSRPFLRHTLFIDHPERWIEHLQRQHYSADAKQSSTKASSAPLLIPDAQQCDSAIENYTKLKSKYEEAVWEPPLPKSVGQRFADVWTILLKALIATKDFTLKVPGWIRALSSMSAEDWRTWWAGAKKTIKHEAHHYWAGCKLLAYDVKIASRLVRKTASGKQLTRRERKQLTRTTADLFRLVPMVIIVVIPFMELALPILLKLFPNMLPSTFEDKLKKEEELKKRLAVKMQVARFLQDTVAEMANNIRKRSTGEQAATAAELYTFVAKVRAGEPVENDELIRFASLFNDELTLDNLERLQLVTLCQFVGITPFGTDAFLRSRLRQHLAQVKKDDLDIKAEGLDNLTPDELRQACRVRGMRTVYGEGAEAYMKRQLRDWLDLSLSRGLPSSLLLLSRAFTITAASAPDKRRAQIESLKETLSTLPEEVIQDVGFEACAEEESRAVELQRKLAFLKKEEELIREEEQEARMQEEAAKAAEAAAAAAAQGDTAGEQVATQAAQQQVAAAAATAIVKAEAAKTFLEGEGVSAEERTAALASAKAAKLRAVISSLAMLASSSGVAKERAMFMDLVKKEVDVLNERISERGSAKLVFTGAGLRAQRPEDTPGVEEVTLPLKLSNRISSMLQDIEKELDVADEQIGRKLHVIDTDNDGVITPDELSTAVQFLREQMEPDELHSLLEELQLQGECGGIPVAELFKLGEQQGEEGCDSVKIHVR